MTMTQVEQDNRADYAGEEPAAATGSAADLSPAGGGADGVAIARAVLAFAVGLAGLIVAFANLDRLMVWSAEYGQTWVFLGFFLTVSVFGRLFWWGVDTIVKTAVRSRGRDGGQ